jgi:hypothetical protein
MELVKKKRDFIARKERIIEEYQFVPDKLVDDYQADLEQTILAVEKAEEQKDQADTLSSEELALVKKTCTALGVSSFHINPGAQSSASLVGTVDDATKEFKEGLISLTMRLALNAIKGGRTENAKA